MASLSVWSEQGTTVNTDSIETLLLWVKPDAIHTKTVVDLDGELLWMEQDAGSAGVCWLLYRPERQAWLR